MPSEGQPKIICVGDLNLDIITPPLEKIPEDEQITVGRILHNLGGSTAICAAACSQLGLETTFVGRAGKDSSGKGLIKKMESYGMDVRVKQSGSTATTLALTRIDGTRSLITSCGANLELCLEDVPQKLGKWDHLHTSGIWHTKKLLPDLGKLLKRAKGYGLTTSADFGATMPDEDWDMVFSFLKHIDILFLNEKEMEYLTKNGPREDQLEKLLKHCQIVALHLGDKGALAASREEKYKKPALDVEVVNSCGAGDVFNAGFLYAYLKGRGLEKALEYGIKNASLYISREEQVFPSAEELEG